MRRQGFKLPGGNHKNVIYWYVENEYGLKREDIPEKPEEFLNGLEKCMAQEPG